MRSKLEGSYTQKLLGKLKKYQPRAIVMKLADRITLGVPDTVMTLDGYTSWWEMKVIRDGDTFNLKGLGKGIQWNTCMKLAEEGRCFYIVFVDKTNDKRILMVEPRDVNIEGPIWEVELGEMQKMVEYMVMEHPGGPRST